MQLINLADEVNLGDIQVSEAFQSGSFSREEGENQSVSIKFIIKGAVDAYPAYLALMNFLRVNFWSDYWGCCASYNLPLQNVSLQSMDCNFAYEATCTFKLPNIESSSSTNRYRKGTSYNNPVINEPIFQMPDIEADDFQYQATGETEHIVKGYGTAAYGVAARAAGQNLVDYGNCIGWNGEGFDGVDILSAIQSFSVGISAPRTWMTDTYRNLLASYANTINFYPWGGYPAGCVLFKGATINSVALNYTDEEGNSVKDWYWRIRYEFEARGQTPVYHPNYTGPGDTSHNWYDASNNSVGPYVMKDGYQYVWYTYHRSTNGSTMFPIMDQMQISDVYMRYDFTNLGIPGLVSQYPSESGSGSGA